MHTVTYRPLSSEEAAQLSAQTPSLPQISLTALVIAVATALPFAAAVFFAGREVPSLDYLAPYGYGLIAIWGVFGAIRAIRSRWAVAGPRVRDLAGNRAELHRYRVDSASVVPGQRDTQPSFLLKLKDGRTLLARGEKFSEAAWQKKFPVTEFVIGRAPEAQLFLSLDSPGDYLEPTVSQVSHTAFEFWHGDPRGHVQLVEIDPNALPAEDSLEDADSGFPAPRQSLISAEFILACIGTLAHVVVAVNTWKGANVAPEPAGLPCDSGKTLSDPHIGYCEEVYYPITGTNGPELWDSIQVNAASREFNGKEWIPFASYVNYKTSWKWDTEKISDDSCRVTRVNAWIRAQYLMPNWLDRATASAALRQRYDEWESASWQALNKLVEFEVQAAREIEDVVGRLPAEDCERIEKRIQAVGSETMYKYEQRREIWSSDKDNVLSRQAARDWMKSWREEASLNTVRAQ